MIINYVDTREVLCEPSSNNRGLERLTRELTNAYCLSCENNGSIIEIIELMRIYSDPRRSTLRLWGDTSKNDHPIKIKDEVQKEIRDPFIAKIPLISLFLGFETPRLRSVKELLLRATRPSYEWIDGRKCLPLYNE